MTGREEKKGFSNENLFVEMNSKECISQSDNKDSKGNSEEAGEIHSSDGRSCSGNNHSWVTPQNRDVAEEAFISHILITFGRKHHLYSETWWWKHQAEKVSLTL